MDVQVKDKSKDLPLRKKIRRRVKPKAASMKLAKVTVYACHPEPRCTNTYTSFTSML